MKLGHDPEHTATGFWWLDWITDPWWRTAAWIAERRLDRTLGITGSTRHRRRIRGELWRSVVRDDPSLLDRGDR